jgi:hypothetical protein
MSQNKRFPNDLRPFRRKLFLGILAWMAFALIGGFIFEHTPMIKLVSIILTGGWCVLAFFMIKYMSYFISGKRE